MGQSPGLVSMDMTTKESGQIMNHAANVSDNIEDSYSPLSQTLYIKYSYLVLMSHSYMKQSRYASRGGRGGGVY